MSRVSFEIVYDGYALSEHQMDVRDLAPALLGIGNLLRDANQVLNRDLASVRVLVDSDHKPGCFSVGLELWQQIQGFLGEENIRTAKDILEWLDLGAKVVITAGAGFGVFRYYKWRAGRPVEVSQQISDTDASGNIQINIKGDHNSITIPKSVLELAHNPKIARAAAAVVAPLEREGIEELKSKVDGVTQLEVTRPEAKQILASCEAVKSDQNILSQQTVVAHLTPYDTVFDQDAKKWEFWYGDRHIPVDISDTTIAKEAVERRSVSMDEMYKVDLEITERRTPTNQIKLDYRIVKVHGRLDGPKQGDLFEEPKSEPPESPSPPDTEAGTPQ